MPGSPAIGTRPRTGTYSDRPGAGREVTLIEREAIEAVNAAGAVAIDESETRRNLVTTGVPLNHLVGRTFRVGEVVLRGYRLAEPCVYLEDMTRPGVRARSYIGPGSGPTSSPVASCTSATRSAKSKPGTALREDDPVPTDPRTLALVLAAVASCSASSRSSCRGSWPA